MDSVALRPAASVAVTKKVARRGTIMKTNEVSGSKEIEEVPAKEINAKLKSVYHKSVLLGLLGVLYLVLYRCSSYIRRDLFSVNATEMEDKANSKQISHITKADIVSIADNRIEREASQIGPIVEDATPGTTGLYEPDGDKIDISLDNDHEPYLNRWQRRFASSKARNMKGGYLFFRHMRKAGGTSLRVYLRDVMLYHNVSRTLDDWKDVKHKDPDGYQIHYIEHEFQTMDWQCPQVDPRWRESLRLVVLRHPIERHLSEFFFSGSGKRFPIDKQQLYVNDAYTNELAQFMSVQVPKWMKLIGNHQEKEGIEGQFNMMFDRKYTDNFQLRALAGCSLGDCLKEKNVTDEQMNKINQFHPLSYSYSAPVPRCTQYYRKVDKPSALFDQCAKAGRVISECPRGCDGPCFFPSAAWGKMDREDLTRAITALKEFDAVLLTEKLNEEDQANFLSDILGVPRDAAFSLVKRDINSNSGVVKSDEREKTHFYRDLLVNLKLKDVIRKLYEENQLEIEFFNYGVQLNQMMIDQWKMETGATT